MAHWEIRVINQEPIRVEVEDTRNLGAEYEAFDSGFHSGRWKFWQRRSPYWYITDTIMLHKDIVVGVYPRKLKTPRPSIGF